MINSRFLDGMTIEQAKEEVARRLENAFMPADNMSQARERRHSVPSPLEGEGQGGGYSEFTA